VPYRNHFVHELCCYFLYQYVILYFVNKKRFDCEECEGSRLEEWTENPWLAKLYLVYRDAYLNDMKHWQCIICLFVHQLMILQLVSLSILCLRLNYGVRIMYKMITPTLLHYGMRIIYEMMTPILPHYGMGTMFKLMSPILLHFKVQI
jgi:hypothetical protein